MMFKGTLHWKTCWRNNQFRAELTQQVLAGYSHINPERLIVHVAMARQQQ